MSRTDKIKNTAQGAKGKLKESAGRLGRSGRTVQRGRNDQLKADVKNAGEHAKQAGAKLKDAAKD